MVGSETAESGDRIFRETFHAHRDAVHAFLFRLTRNRADADDLVQDTFVAVWRNGWRYEGRGAALGYLRRTAFRLYLNEREKRMRRAAIDAARASPPSEPMAPAADGEVARKDALAFLAARVEEALAGLPDEPREAFVLFRYEGMTCEEIGEAMGVPAKTVETRVRRATGLLAERLRPYRDLLAAR